MCACVAMICRAPSSQPKFSALNANCSQADSTSLIDTSDAIARQLKCKFKSQSKYLDQNKHESIGLISSKDADTLHQIAQELMQSDLHQHRIKSQLVSAFK